MNNAARSDLLLALEHMQQHGDHMSMLVITVRGTSDGLLAGIKEKGFSLDYPRVGWLDFVRAHRFASFCRRRGLSLRTERWGKERVSRAAIGSITVDAVQTIDECLTAVYHHSGPFGLELRGFGWQPLSARSGPMDNATLRLHS
jgi:hypothetical protein